MLEVIKLTGKVELLSVCSPLNITEWISTTTVMWRMSTMYCSSGILSGLHLITWGLQDNFESFSDGTLDFPEVIFLILKYYQTPSFESAFYSHIILKAELV